MIFISNDQWMDCPIVHQDFHQVLAAEKLSILGLKMHFLFFFGIPDAILGVFQLFWEATPRRNECCFTGKNRLMDGTLSG